MKKIKVIVAFLLALTLISANYASAAESNESVVYSSNPVFAEGINNSGSHQTFDSESVTAQATGIIASNYLSLSKDGTTLTVRGQTTSYQVSLKIGFTYVRIQKYVSGAWQNYASWLDIYNTDSLVCSTVKTYSVSSGTYRAVCEHYAEQDGILWFKNTEKIANSTTSLVV